MLGLVPTEDLEEYEHLGIRAEAESLCWTCRAEQLPAFLAHLQGLGARRPQVNRLPS